jgi:hypothetical protein
MLALLRLWQAFVNYVLCCMDRLAQLAQPQPALPAPLQQSWTHQGLVYALSVKFTLARLVLHVLTTFYNAQNARQYQFAQNALWAFISHPLHHACNAPLDARIVPHLCHVRNVYLLSLKMFRAIVSVHQDIIMMEQRHVWLAVFCPVVSSAHHRLHAHCADRTIINKVDQLYAQHVLRTAVAAILQDA